LRRTVNNNSYATYNSQPDQALFYLKPVLKRKQKNRPVAVFLAAVPGENLPAPYSVGFTLDSIRALNAS
jgi:hypothetical protein